MDPSGESAGQRVMLKGLLHPWSSSGLAQCPQPYGGEQCGTWCVSRLSRAQVKARRERTTLGDAGGAAALGSVVWAARRR